MVGFDDLPVARWVSPPLTTVRQPLAEMGRAAAQMLGELIEDRPLRSRRVELSTELIMRESTGPVPGTTRLAAFASGRARWRRPGPGRARGDRRASVAHAHGRPDLIQGGRGDGFGPLVALPQDLAHVA